MEKRNHSVSKLVRLTPEEAKELTSRALEQNMSESAYLRLMITQSPKTYPEVQKQIKNLTNEVNYIGHNINQIVKNFNSGFYSEADKSSLKAYMRKVYAKVDEAVRVLGNQ